MAVLDIWYRIASMIYWLFCYSFNLKHFLFYFVFFLFQLKSEKVFIFKYLINNLFCILYADLLILLQLYCHIFFELFYQIFKCYFILFLFKRILILIGWVELIFMIGFRIKRIWVQILILILKFAEISENNKNFRSIIFAV